MIFKNNKVYDILKWLVMIVLPAFVTFWSLMAETWNIPYGPQIATTINGVTAFAGACLMISSAKYSKKLK